MAGPTVLYRTDDGGQTWQSKLTWDGQGPAQLLFSPDGTEGLAVGYLGVPLFSTSDRGDHWQRMRLPPDAEQVALVYFLDPREGWIISYLNETTPGFAGLFHTTDGAKHWTRVARLDVGKVFNHVVSGGSLQGDLMFRDSMHGWFVGANFSGTGIPVVEPYMYVTRDGGKTWGVQTLPNAGSVGLDSTNSSLESPKFFNPQDGLLVVSKFNLPEPGTSTPTGFLQGSFVYSSTDGGASWSGPRAFVLPDDFPLFGIQFVDANHWFTPAKSGVAGTSDGGQHWTASTNWLPPNAVAAKIYFQDASHGWAGVVIPGGHPGLALYKTSDAGDHWTRIAVPNIA